MKLNILKLLLAAGLVNLVFSFSGTAQDNRSGTKSIQYYSRISRIPTNFPDSTQLRFDISVPIENLIFIPKESGYFAGVKFNLFILDKDHNAVFESNQTFNVKVLSYIETQADSVFQQFSIHTNVSPGKYKVVIEAIDTNIGVSEFSEFELKILDYTGKKIVLGDLLLFDGSHNFSLQDPDSIIASPSNICREDFTIYSKIYLADSNPDLNVQINWYDNNRKILSEPVSLSQNGKFLSLYKSYSIKEVQQGQFDLEFSISGENFKAKTPELRIEVIKRIAYFKEESLDKAIEYMAYIGEGAVWDSLKNVQTLEEKKVWFDKFWQQYYQTSETEINPVREEYFSRIRYANRKFNDGSEGWRSDRGRTFIVYGQPNEVQRSTDNMMRRMEIWIYQALEKQFVFLDTDGTGSYRLIRGY